MLDEQGGYAMGIVENMIFINQHQVQDNEPALETADFKTQQK